MGMHQARMQAYARGITHRLIGRSTIAIWPTPTMRSGMKKVTQMVEYTWLAQSYMYLADARAQKRVRPRDVADGC